MQGVTRGAVWTAGLVLVAVAGVGSYVGYSRASTAPGGSADEDAYTAATPLTAKKATALNDGPAPPPPVDEAYIRKIAHDEAMTILHPPPKKVAVAQASDDDDDDSDDDSKDAGANPPTPPPVAAQPAPVAVPKPPPPPTGLY